MRRTFAQVLKEAKIDPKMEYQKLYGMLFDRSIQVSNTKRISAYDELSDFFFGFYFRGTCLSIDEFNNMHGFNFEREPADFNIDHLILLCEYIQNMLMGYQGTQNYNGWGYMPMQQPAINMQFYFAQIAQVIEKIGYMASTQDSFCIFVPKDNTAIAVSESKLIPDSMSYKVIAYNHHSMKKNLDGKRQTLLGFADLLEPRRNDLKAADKLLESDLFYAFNNFNIRHNNIDSTGPKYKKPIGDLTDEQLEYWYDNVYQMCLLAFMQLEHAEHKKEFDTLKNSIESKKA